MGSRRGRAPEEARVSQHAATDIQVRRNWRDRGEGETKEHKDKGRTAENAEPRGLDELAKAARVLGLRHGTRLTGREARAGQSAGSAQNARTRIVQSGRALRILLAHQSRAVRARDCVCVVPASATALPRRPPRCREATVTPTELVRGRCFYAPRQPQAWPGGACPLAAATRVESASVLPRPEPI